MCRLCLHFEPHIESTTAIACADATVPAAHEGFGVELHNVPRSALSRVIKEFITRDKVPRNTSWEIILEGAGGPDSLALDGKTCATTAEQLPEYCATIVLQLPSKDLSAYAYFVTALDTSAGCTRQKKNDLLFCIYLVKLYLWLRLRYFRSAKQ